MLLNLVIAILSSTFSELNKYSLGLYYDSLVKAIQQVGNILVETIPTFYGDERDVQLIKRNGQSSTKSVNGSEDKHQLTLGKFGVVVETGPSYATRRQESVEAMTTLGQVYPASMPLIADIIASESDWPGAKQVAARLRLALPQVIQQAEAANGDADPAQQAQQAMAQVQQLNQKLQQAEQLIQHGHQEVTNLNEEIKMLKTKAAIDMSKAADEKEIKNKQLILDEMTTELEFKIKMREIELQEAELQLEKDKMGISGIKVASDIANDMHGKHVEHLDKMRSMTAEFNDVPGPDMPAGDIGTELNKRDLD